MSSRTGRIGLDADAILAGCAATMGQPGRAGRNSGYKGSGKTPSAGTDVMEGGAVATAKAKGGRPAKLSLPAVLGIVAGVRRG